MRVHVGYALSAAVLFACARPFRSEAGEGTQCPPKPALPPVQMVADAPSVISGRVWVAQVELPLPGSPVRIPEVGRIATTDTAGFFHFDSMPPGVYTLVVRQIGVHERSVQGVTVSSRQGRNVHVPVKPFMLDGCPGFGELLLPRPWWKFW